MSHAQVYLYDESGNVTSSVQIEDTCGKAVLNFDLLCTQMYLVGNNGDPDNVFPLGKCQADCDAGYKECAEGLSCMDRDYDEVPGGCVGEALDHEDYCVVRPVDHLWYVGDEGENGLLGKCEGDW